MATIFERVGSSVLITVGSEDPIGAAAGSFVKPDPRNTDIIVISEKANPQLENEGIRVKVSDVSTPANTGRADLITKLMTDFFFRVSTPSSALATDYFYLKSEVDAAIPYKDVIIENVQHLHTGNTTATTVFTGIIPAGSIGANGRFELDALFSCNNSAGSKTVTIKFESYTVITTTLTTSQSASMVATIRNRNSLTSQVSYSSGVVGQQGVSSAALSTYSLNTANAITVTVTVTLTNGADNAALESLRIKAVK